MHEADRKRFAELITGACEYYEKRISEQTLDFYWRALLEYSIEDLEFAAAAHVRDQDRGRFMPKVADFVFAIEGSADECAALAWDLILRNRGTDDPAANAAIKSMGGWQQAIGRQNEQDLPFIAKNFQTRYKAFKRREQMPEIGSEIMLKLVK